jgi:solute carrier family 36 (proton-coupled amino acid transporter)
VADAVKNGGLLLAPVLTLFLGIVCVHAQHILLQCSQKMKDRYQLTKKPDYAETVELCFASSSSERWRRLAPAMKAVCNIFICITQLGFCCIYFLFIGTNLKQVLDFYGYELDIHVLVALVLIPIWLSTLITNLKYLGKVGTPLMKSLADIFSLVFQLHVQALPTYA